jgi:hypothetical protein
MSKFGPSEFSPEETKALADKLSDYDLLSRDSLAKLIKQGKLPSLAAGAEIAGTTGTQSVDGATTKSLTSEQSNYMSIIRKQLLAGGYNGDFVQAICSAMEKMYTESFTFEGETFESFNDFLDAKLPETIKSAGGVSYANVEKRKDNYGTFSEEVDGMVKYGEWGAYPTSDSKAVHQMVTDEDSIKLRKTLTVARAAYFENHGADFSLIQGWLLGQLFSSWSKGPTSVKILLIQNKKCRTDVQDCVYLDPYEEDYILSKMQVQPSDKFRKSLVLQKAFTAIALSKIEAPGVIDSENATIKLRRGLILSKNFRKRNGLQGVAAEDMVGREFTEAKNGIADSTALGTPSPTFCFTSTYGMYRNSPKVVVEYEMPICDVHAAFMFEEKLQAIGNEFMKWQHEVICDLVDKKAKIIYVDLIKNEHAQEL